MALCPACAGSRRTGIPLAPCRVCNGAGSLKDLARSPDAERPHVWRVSGRQSRAIRRAHKSRSRRTA